MLTGIALALVIAVACRPRSPVSAQAIADVRARTLPAGSTLLTATDPTLRDSTLEAAWELVTPMSWKTYLQRVGNDLPGFSAVYSRADAALFRQSLPGDNVELKLELLTPGPSARVRATWSARPD